MCSGRSEAPSAAGTSPSSAAQCLASSFPQLPAGITAHVGTADLDFHLSLHLLDGETADYYRAIIDGLSSLGLRPDIQDGREIKWRWVGSYRPVQAQGGPPLPVGG